MLSVSDTAYLLPVSFVTVNAAFCSKLITKYCKREENKRIEDVHLGLGGIWNWSFRVTAMCTNHYTMPHIRRCGQKLLIIIICVNKELNKLKILTNGKVKCDGKNWQSVSFWKSWREIWGVDKCMLYVLSTTMTNILFSLIKF